MDAPAKSPSERASQSTSSPSEGQPKFAEFGQKSEIYGHFTAKHSRPYKTITSGFLTLPEAAMALDIPERTARRWVASGKLPATVKGTGQRQSYLVSPAAIELLKQQIQAKKVQSKRDQSSQPLNRPHIDFVNGWVQAMNAGTLTGRVFSPFTAKIYAYYVNCFFERHKGLAPQTLEAELKLTPAHQFGKRDKLYKALVSFAKWLIRQGVLDASFTDAVKPFRPVRHKPPKRNTVTESQLDALYGACESQQDRLIVMLLSQTGVRAAEFCALKVSDIDLEAQTLTVACGKGGKRRRVGLSIGLAMHLGAHLHQHAAGALFLNNIGKPMDPSGLFQRVQRIGQTLGIEAAPHALRRAFVTHNANKGRPLQMLQRACGHSDIRTTMSYCQTSEQEVTEAMKSWND